LRIKVGIGLWIWAFCVLASSAAEEVAPVTGRQDWMKVVWALLKIAFLVYAGILLFTADEEIERLAYSNKSSERFIGEILKKVNAPKTP